jgi:hypothetical protein
MSKHRVEATVSYPPDAVAVACQEAVAQLGWRILNQSSGGITCKEMSSSAVSFTWPAKIEVTWQGRGTTTKLSLNGSIVGFGPIQSNHLKGQMGNLQNRIDLCLRNSAASQAPPSSESSLASELARLAELRSQGVLSEEEFRAAKAKLVG